MEVSELLDPRVLFVTGKGGVGKSSVAATLAIAAVRSGRRTCLVEVEGRQTMSRILSTEPWDFEEREMREELYGLSVDPEASLAEYLDMFYGARRLSKLVVGSTAVEFATTAAPGIKDVLLVGKVKEMERRRDPDGSFHYDLVVVDAPPTGRIVDFLRAPDTTTELVGVGPIRAQAQSLVDMLLDPDRTRIQLVTLLEEMPVAETVESAATLRELGVSIGPVIVNRVVEPKLDAAGLRFLDRLEPARVTARAAEAGVLLDGVGAALRERGLRHRRRLGLQEEMRGRLAQVDAPTIDLPFLASRRFGEREIDVLADHVVDLMS